MDNCTSQWKSKPRHYFIMLNCHWLLVLEGPTAGLAVNPFRNDFALNNFILKDEVGTDEKPERSSDLQASPLDLTPAGRVSPHKGTPQRQISWRKSFELLKWGISRRCLVRGEGRGEV